MSKSPAAALPGAPPPSLWHLFLGFLMIGATSLGGGVIAYLRTGLVARYRGWPGALVAALGMCLPGASLMTAAAFAYGIGGDDPVSKAFLHAIAAGAVGLITVVLVQLGAKMLTEIADYVFVAMTAVLVAFVHVPVPIALVGMAAVAIWWHRPRKAAGKAPDAQPKDPAS